MRTQLQRRKPSHGTMLIIALVMLTFLLLLGAALTRATILFHQQRADDERQQQAILLSESGVQRAIHAHNSQADYPGETWRVSAETLGGTAVGVVTIRVEAPATNADAQRRLVVEATYPATGTQRFVYRRALEIPSKSPKPPAADAVNGSFQEFKINDPRS